MAPTPYNAEEDAAMAPQKRNVWGVFAMRANGKHFDYTHGTTKPILSELDWTKPVSAYFCTDGFPSMHQRSRHRYKLCYCPDVIAWLCTLHSKPDKVQAMTEFQPYFAFINLYCKTEDRARITESFIKAFETKSGCEMVVDKDWDVHTKTVVEASNSAHYGDSKCMVNFYRILKDNITVFQTSSNNDHCIAWKVEDDLDEDLLALVEGDEDLLALVEGDEDLLALVNGEDEEGEDEDEDEDGDGDEDEDEDGDGDGDGDGEDEDGDDDDEDLLALVENEDLEKLLAMVEGKEDPPIEIDSTAYPTAMELYTQNRTMYDTRCKEYQQTNVTTLFPGREPTQAWQHYTAAVYRSSVPWPNNFRFKWPDDHKLRDAYFRAEYKKIPDNPSDEDTNESYNKRHFESCATAFSVSIEHDRAYDDMMSADRAAKTNEPLTTNLTSVRFNEAFPNSMAENKCYRALITVEEWHYGDNDAKQNTKSDTCNGVFLLLPYDTRVGLSDIYGFYVGVENCNTRRSMVGGTKIFENVMRSDVFRGEKSCMMNFDVEHQCFMCMITSGTPNNTYYVLKLKAVEIQSCRPDDGKLESELIHVRDRDIIRNVKELNHPAMTNAFRGMTGKSKTTFKKSARKRRTGHKSDGSRKKRRKK